MTGFLASIKNIEEAKKIIDAKVDIVDLAFDSIEDLLAKISDLEAEIMIMREEGKGASLETKKMVAQLNQDLSYNLP